MLKEIVCNILCYIDKNTGNIIVTLLSVVASGWISLLISRHYFEKGEILLFDNLLSAYKSYIDYSPEAEIHKMLMAFSKRKLSENGLEWEPIVTEDEYGNFEGDPPIGQFELEEDIGKVLEKYPYQCMSKECQDALEVAFAKCLSGISAQKKIAFFENTSINKLIQEAEVVKRAKRY